MRLFAEQQCDWPWQQLPEQVWWQVAHLPIYLQSTVKGRAQTLAENEAVLLACTCRRLKAMQPRLCRPTTALKLGCWLQVPQ